MSKSLPKLDVTKEHNQTIKKILADFNRKDFHYSFKKSPLGSQTDRNDVNYLFVNDLENTAYV